MNRQSLYIALLSALVALAVIINVRFFSPEDDWTCQSGKWVAHGHPSAAAPTTPCK